MPMTAPRITRELKLKNVDRTVTTFERKLGSSATILTSSSLLVAPPPALLDQGDRFVIPATLTLGLAVLSGATSLTLFLTHKKKRQRERQTAGLEIDIRGAGATATLRF